MKIAVFWRKNRNVEFQKKLMEENIFDDAYEEARSHKEGLEEAGFDTILVEWTGEPIEMSKKIEEEKISFVFNASSDDELRFLEAFKISYTGTRLQISGLDRAYRKIIVAHFGVSTPEFTLAYSKDTLPEIKMDYPLFVKPLNGRGSAGISEENIIRSPEELPSVVGKITEKMSQPALIEGFIEGRELTVGIIGYKTPIVLPLLEIGYTFGNTNTYEHKMLDQEIIRCPMKIPKEVEEKIIKMALKIYKTLDIADYGRVDMILGEAPTNLKVRVF